MERPERKIYGFLQIGLQAIEDRRYNKAVKDYDEWVKIDRERQRLENESLKLQNEEKRALVESLRKQQNIGGSENIYDRVKSESESEKSDYIAKSWLGKFLTGQS